MARCHRLLLNTLGRAAGPEPDLPALQLILLAWFALLIVNGLVGLADCSHRRPDVASLHRGDQGVKLSGGQRQRLSLARA